MIRWYIGGTYLIRAYIVEVDVVVVEVDGDEVVAKVTDAHNNCSRRSKLLLQIIEELLVEADDTRVSGAEQNNVAHLDGFRQDLAEIKDVRHLYVPEVSFCSPFQPAAVAHRRDLVQLLENAF